MTQEEGLELLDRLDTLLLDCDGVLYRGATLLPHTAEALQAFRDRGKRLLFVTNNASKSRAEYVAKFTSLGLQVSADEIVSSAYAAGAYLAEVPGLLVQGAADASGVSGGAGDGASSSCSSSSSNGTGGSSNGGGGGGAPAQGKVLVVGTDGFVQELRHAGLRCTTYDELGLPQPWALEAFASHALDPAIRAVAVGWDPAFHYGQLCLASAYVREQGCLYIATNLDNGDRVDEGMRLMPGTGCLVDAISAVAGVRPVVVGKGGGWLVPHLQQLYDLDPARTAMIGDRMDTDIAMGRQAGFVSVLVLTGVGSLEQVATAGAGERPDHVAAALPTLAGLGL